MFLEPTQGNMGGAFGIAVSDTDVYVGSCMEERDKTFLSSPDLAGEMRSLVLSRSDLYARAERQTCLLENGVINVLPIAVGKGWNARINVLAIKGNDIYACGLEAWPNNEVHCVYWKSGVGNKWPY